MGMGRMMGMTSMDNGYLMKLRILEADMDEVIDGLMMDGRINEDIRKEYGKNLREIMYARIDGIDNGSECSMNFK